MAYRNQGYFSLAKGFQIRNSTVITTPNFGTVTEMLQLRIQGNAVVTTVNASSLTTVAESISVYNNPLLTTLDFPALASGSIYIANNTILNTVDLSALQNADYLTINQNPQLANIDLSALATVVREIQIYQNNQTTIDLSSLVTVGEQVSMTENAVVTTIDLSSLTTVGTTTPDNLYIHNNYELVNVIMSGAINAQTILASNGKLSQASVDAILAAAVGGTLNGGTITINGGTNSTPSAAGLINVGILQGRGYVVNHN